MEQGQRKPEDVQPDYKGRYWCPFRCGPEEYPQPRWKTQKGYLAHLEKCPLAQRAKWRPAPLDPAKQWGTCAECFTPIMTGDSIWQLAKAAVCMTCALKNPERRDGFNDCAGLELAGLSDIVG